jgi:hypothetical protein
MGVFIPGYDSVLTHWVQGRCVHDILAGAALQRLTKLCLYIHANCRGSALVSVVRHVGGHDEALVETYCLGSTS